jgi:hypothetical protein
LEADAQKGGLGNIRGAERKRRWEEKTEEIDLKDSSQQYSHLIGFTKAREVYILPVKHQNKGRILKNKIQDQADCAM